MKELSTYPLGNMRVNCLKTLKKLSMCLPDNTPSAPSVIWYWKTHLSHLHQQAQEQPTDCSPVFLGKQSPVPNGFTFPLAYPFYKFVHSWSKVPGFITESGFSVALKCKSMVKGKVCRDSWTITECPSLEKVKFVYVECGGSVSVLCYFFPTNCCLALFLFALLVFTL